MEFLEVVLERDAYILIPKEKGGNLNKDVLLPEYVESPIEIGEKNRRINS